MSKILVTGGPTRAYLDEVRFLSNYSTGKTALEICQVLAKAGHKVEFICGPVSEEIELPRSVKVCRVETTREMHQMVLKRCKTFRPAYAIFAAAVLDFEPEKRAGKVSSRRGFSLRLKPTPKIIDEVRDRFPKIKRIGFKLEWSRQGKTLPAERVLEKKGYEALCFNYLSEIRGKKHPAILVDRRGKRLGKTKKDIAKFILEVVQYTAA